MSDEDFSRHALAYLKESKKLKHDETLAHQVLPAFKDNVVRLEELEDRLKVLDEDFGYEDEGLVKTPAAKEIFQASLAVLNEIQKESDPFCEYEMFVEKLKPRVKAKGKDLFLPLRVGLTGRLHGPELKRIFPLLGLTAVKRRLERAVKI